ncbi:MAG: triose-phosphate isomerase, partial [Pseudomonadota bacterium]
MALIVGNWKMNGLKDGLGEARAIAQGAASIGEDRHQLVICPPATSLMIFSEVLKATPVFTGGQDCHPEVSGAHTGRISAEMLADAGASYCIVGHSECRDELGDNDEILSLKVKAVLRAG